MICLQPGIIAWNAPQKIFNLFQTYLCDLDQVLFVCILSDIFQGKKINIQENQFSFLQSKKKIFMKHKAKLMGNDYLT